MSDKIYRVGNIRPAVHTVFDRTPLLSCLNAYAKETLAQQVRDGAKERLGGEHKFFTTPPNVHWTVFSALRDTTLFCVMNKAKLEAMAKEITDEVVALGPFNRRKGET